MMHQSRRARRMERKHKARKQPALNLVSLMDIFTILVFFLLVNSSSSQQLPNSKDIRLPTSVTKKAPEETLVISITKKDILVQDTRVASVRQTMQSQAPVIESLQAELNRQAGKGLFPDRKPQKGGRPVTIMGDEDIPYELLRKILATCRQADYTKIAFAAMQKPDQNGRAE
jgi:biopolymer transport protein ExbD